MRDEALIKIEDDENVDSQDGSYHSVLEKNFIRSDGPYLIRLRKPPSKENEGSDSKRVGHPDQPHRMSGDEFNRDVQQATSMMVDIIDNHKEDDQYREADGEAEDYTQQEGDYENMQKGDLAIPHSSRALIHPTSKDDGRKYGRVGFPNSNMETPNNRQNFVYSPILSKRGGTAFLNSFMPFSPSNPNTATAGKKCGFTINQGNPLVNPQIVGNKMDKSIINLKQNISKGNKLNIISTPSNQNSAKKPPMDPESLKLEIDQINSDKPAVISGDYDGTDFTNFGNQHIEGKESGAKSPNFLTYPESNPQDVQFVLDIPLIDSTYIYNDAIQNEVYPNQNYEPSSKTPNKDFDPSFQMLNNNMPKDNTDSS